MDVEEMLAKHVRVEKVLCGARGRSRNGEQHVFSGATDPRALICTLPFGHEPELHKDGRCCWQGHRFVSEEPDDRPGGRKREVEDWSTCEHDGERWPCSAVRLHMAMTMDALPMPAKI